MIELSTIRDFVAIFGVIAGFSYYILTVRVNQKNQELNLKNQEIMIQNQEETLKTRNATIYHQVMASILSPQGIRNIRLLNSISFSNYEEYNDLSKSNPDFGEAVLWFFNFLEMTGIYIKKGVADIEYFALMNPHMNLSYWYQYKPIIYKLREKYGPLSWRNMEYAFDSLQKYLEEHPELAP